VKGEEHSEGCCVGVHLRARFPPTTTRWNRRRHPLLLRRWLSPLRLTSPPPPRRFGLPLMDLARAATFSVWVGLGPFLSPLVSAPPLLFSPHFVDVAPFAFHRCGRDGPPRSSEYGLPPWLGAGSGAALPIFWRRVCFGHRRCTPGCPPPPAAAISLPSSVVLSALAASTARLPLLWAGAWSPHLWGLGCAAFPKLISCLPVLVAAPSSPAVVAPPLPSATSTHPIGICRPRSVDSGAHSLAGSTAVEAPAPLPCSSSVFSANSRFGLLFRWWTAVVRRCLAPWMHYKECVN
jgi:hypothetical protein